jgi:hypothetical protein
VLVAGHVDLIVAAERFLARLAADNVQLEVAIGNVLHVRVRLEVAVSTVRHEAEDPAVVVEAVVARVSGEVLVDCSLVRVDVVAVGRHREGGGAAGRGTGDDLGRSELPSRGRFTIVVWCPSRRTPLLENWCHTSRAT